MSYLDRIAECNNFSASGFYPFFCEAECVGLVSPSFAELLRGFHEVFVFTGDQISLQPHLVEVSRRTEAVAAVVASLLDAGHVEYLLDEPYPVKGQAGKVLLVIDRAMVPYLGFRSFGQHLNGFVRAPDGLRLWIARRAADRRIFPGMLDNMVAGGLPHGLSLQENLLKECQEEAGMSAELALQARAVSAISYNALSNKGYKPDTLYCYDIELPMDFVPENTDGEVQEFTLMAVEDVMQMVRKGGLFKPNCHLVLIDFFVRHGLLDPQDSGFLAIQQGLHVPFHYDRFE